MGYVCMYVCVCACVRVCVLVDGCIILGARLCTGLIVVCRLFPPHHTHHKMATAAGKSLIDDIVGYEVYS